MNLEKQFYQQFQTVEKKSDICEEGEAHLRICFWNLLINLKNK